MSTYVLIKLSTSDIPKILLSNLISRINEKKAFLNFKHLLVYKCVSMTTTGKRRAALAYK